MGAISLPGSVKSKLPNHKAFNWLKNPKVTLGLDLQGGTQLDYRIDLRNAEAKNKDDDKSNDVRIKDIVEGVRATIERRVNGLGVSEPQIYLSNIADEQHIIVELAGIKDVNKAKSIVGKTIQLEFKEKKTEMDAGEKDKVKKEAEATLKKVLAKNADFTKIGKSTATSDKKIQFFVNKTKYESDIPSHYKDVLSKLKEDQIHKKIVEGSDGYMVGANNQLQKKVGMFIVQLVKAEVKDRTQKKKPTFSEIAKELNTKLETLNDKPASAFTDGEAEAVWKMTETGADNKTKPLEVKDELRVYKLIKHNKGEKEIKASHILIAYKGAQRADAKVTRTKAEADKKVKEVYIQANKDPSKFAELAKKHSDGPSASKGGDLGFFGKGKMTKAFENAAFARKKGEIAQITETEFGYHIIKVTDTKPPKDETVNLELLKLKKSDENKKKLEAGLKKIKEGYDVTTKEKEYKYNEIYFDMTPDPWKSTGLDGSHFKFASVTYNQIGSPEVSIRFDSKGGDMFEKITGRLVGQPLAIFVGGQLISAPNVNGKISGGSAVITGNYNIKEAMQLANDLNTGAIDAPVILSGQYTISATLGESALRVSLIAGLLGLIVLALYMIVYYRIFGLFAVFALLIYSIIIMFILNTTGIVMTLAGIAGIILSIGMAVDANILIFERTKEELNTGKNFSASITAGFERAWSSIRDSNVSSLITCAILWFFGNSIIRGFALMLAIGILISMFTAITITRKFLQSLTGTSLSKKRWLLGVKKVETINR